MNGLEEEVMERLLAQGYAVLRNGWPDFLAVKGNKVRFIEVKGPMDFVRPSQKKVHDALKEKIGVTVEIVHHVQDLDYPPTDPDILYPVVRAGVETVWYEIRTEDDWPSWSWATENRAITKLAEILSEGR